MNNLKAILNVLMHKVCKMFGYVHVYQSYYGIKVYNKPLFKKIKFKKNIKMIESEKIYLGFDGLKDSFTLIDLPISNSPHFDLMYRLENNIPISNCEYCKREKNGYLDGRYEMLFTKKNIIFHKSKYIKMKEYISCNKYEPVLVYKLKGKYYIIDGKHRAALCALQKKKVKCIVVDLALIADDQYCNILYKYMLKKKLTGKYNKNYLHIKEIIN